MIQTQKPTGSRWLSIFCLIVFFQLIFYFVAGLTIYAIATLNYQILALIFGIILLQLPFSRSITYIRFINSYIRPLWYFHSFKRIYQEEVIEGEKCLFAFHPHSIFCYCILANMNVDNSKMSSLTGLSSRFMLNVPIIGLFLRLWGVESVDPLHMKKMMSSGKTLGLLPGGFEEATLTNPNQMRIYIKKRKGFIKYALKYGYTIYPVLNYNEHRAFWTLQSFEKIRLLMNKFKMPGVIYGGGFLQWFFPFNIDLVTIVGKGIKRKKQLVDTEPTVEEVEEVHEQYMKELQRLHDKHRKEGGDVEIKFY